MQTNYQSVQFTTPEAIYTSEPGVAVSNPDPLVLVIENNQSIGSVPVMLATSGSPTTSGVWTETRAAPQQRGRCLDGGGPQQSRGHDAG